MSAPLLPPLNSEAATMGQLCPIKWNKSRSTLEVTLKPGFAVPGFFCCPYLRPLKLKTFHQALELHRKTRLISWDPHEPHSKLDPFGGGDAALPGSDHGSSPGQQHFVLLVAKREKKKPVRFMPSFCLGSEAPKGELIEKPSEQVPGKPGTQVLAGRGKGAGSSGVGRRA